MDYIVASRPGGSRNASSRFMLQNRNKRRQLRARLAPLGFTFIYKPNNVNHVDAHFEVFSKCIAMKSNQGFSLR